MHAPPVAKQKITVASATKLEAKSSRPEMPSPRLLQQCIGNRAALRLQARLKIGGADDPAEREAEQVAEMMSRPANHRPSGHPPGGPPAPASALLRRETAVHRRAGPAAAHDAGAAAEARIPTSGGDALPESLQQDFQSRLGFDFSRVRIHADSAAAESASELEADAYTVGRDVVFARGQYSPWSAQGRRLLAHELTHVVQQGHAGRPADGSPPFVVQRRCDACADEDERRVVQRQPARVAPRARSEVVEDDRVPMAGQMRRSPFLALLQNALIAGCDAEMIPFGRTAQDCPYIVRSIAHYARLPLAHVLRMLQRFGGVSPGANAHVLIDAVVRRARRVTRRLVASPRVQGMSVRADRELEKHDPLSVRAQLGAGRSLDVDVRERMERAFGTSFAGVRVHTDAPASRLNRELGARAFTIGSDVAFAPGQYQPGTLQGDALIGHELAHTVQQKGALERSSPVAPDGDAERAADRAAVAAVFGRHELASALPPSAPGLRIQRDGGVGEVILVAALLSGEVGTEVVVADAVVTIGAEVVVAEAAPLAVAELAPVAAAELAPALTTATGVTAATTTAATTTVAMTTSTLATVGTLAATSTLLSSDSPPPEEDDPTRRPCPPWAPPGSKPIIWPFPTWTLLGHGDDGSATGWYDLPGPPGVSLPLMIPSLVIKVGSPARRDTAITNRYRSTFGPTSGVPSDQIRIHHKWPLFLNGPDTEDNLVILSQAEHVAWHDRLYRQAWGYMLTDVPNPKSYCIVGVGP